MVDKTQSRILITVTLPPHYFLPDPLLLPHGWQNTEPYTNNSYTPTPTVPPLHHPAFTWLTKKHTELYTNNSYNPSPTFPLWPPLPLGWQKNTELYTNNSYTIPPQHSLRDPLQLLLGWQKKHRAVYYSNNSYTTTPTFPQRPSPASTQLTKKHRAVYYSNNSSFIKMHKNFDGPLMDDISTEEELCSRLLRWCWLNSWCRTVDETPLSRGGGGGQCQGIGLVHIGKPGQNGGWGID
jgi:hypothetical protein